MHLRRCIREIGRGREEGRKRNLRRGREKEEEEEKGTLRLSRV